MMEEEERAGKICPCKCQREDADELIGPRVRAVLMMMEVRVCLCVCVFIYQLLISLHTHVASCLSDQSKIKPIDQA